MKTIWPIKNKFTGRHLFDAPYRYDDDTVDIAGRSITKGNDCFYIDGDLPEAARQELITRIEADNERWESDHGLAPKDAR